MHRLDFLAIDINLEIGREQALSDALALYYNKIPGYIIFVAEPSGFSTICQYDEGRIIEENTEFFHF